MYVTVHTFSTRLCMVVHYEIIVRTQKRDIDRKKLIKKWSDLKQDETKRHMAGFEEEVAYNREMATHRREIRKTGGGSPPVPPSPLAGDAVNPAVQSWPPTGHTYNPRYKIFKYKYSKQTNQISNNKHGNKDNNI